jgi:hypothetical protein
LIESHACFSWILNRELRFVPQHACVLLPNAVAPNLFISGIAYALDTYHQSPTPVYAVFSPGN